MRARLAVLFLMFSLSGLARAQSTPAQVAAILARQLQTQDVTIYQLRQYAMSRVPKLSVPATAAEWSAEGKRLRTHILEHVVFHGWPREWVSSPAKFEDLGLMDSGPGYRMRKLRYEIVPGFLSTAILYEPENLRGKVPAILNVNGHVGAPGKAIEYKQKRCINFAKQGILALNLEWIGMGELTHPENVHWFGAHLDLVGANAVGLWYLAMRRGLDYLDAHPNVDRNRIGMTGLSGGGWQTILLSSLDERVTVAVPVAGYSALASRIQVPNNMGDVEQQPTDFFAGQDYSHLTAMRAPRPTLIIGNAEDDCCYVGPIVRPYIYDDVKPFFRLYGKEDALAYHENTDPGTHNYQLDNRLQAYRFFSKQFNLPLTENEIEVGAEIRSENELAVGLPKDNLTILGLAKKVAADFKRSPVPSAGPGRTDWIASEREKLKRAARYKPTTIKHAWAVSNTKNEGVESLSYRFEFENGLSATGVWLKAIATPTNAPITIVLHDKGKKAAREEVSDRTNRTEQVLAADLIFTGDMAVTEPGPWAYPELLASMGDRALGIEAGQLIALAHWLRTTSGASRLRLESTGIRNQVAAVIAAALEPNLFSQVVIRGGLRSLSYLLDAPVDFLAAPDLFCLDLYKEFDLDRLEILAEPSKVVHQTFVELPSK